MVIVLKSNAMEQEVSKISVGLQEQGLQVDRMVGVGCIILGIIGDTTIVDKEKLEANESVEKVMRISDPYKRANRKFHPLDSIIKVGEQEIDGSKLAIIAGPCSVESEEQITEIAREVKKSGARFLRGGAFKPRTSPYDFQGLEAEGLELLKIARNETKLPFVTEITSARWIEKYVEDVDIIQVGARNMQNFELLKELGKTNKPILLKRGLSATIKEWVMSAEYILANGNPNVIFCERGIRTFEDYTRNTLDISAILAVKSISHLPVIVDPSHATGKSWMVNALSKAAIVAGADGLIIEVHNDPANAKCDGPQSIKPEAFDELMKDLQKIAPIVNRTI